MEVLETPLAGVLVLKPHLFEDDRGAFFTAFDDVLAREKLKTEFVQHSHSISKAGVVRALHYQEPDPQTKMVRVVAGASFDVVVDIRPKSPAFGQWFGLELSRENRKQIFIPHGYAHGYMALKDDTEIVYALGARYNPNAQKTVIWDDPDIGIKWPSGYRITVSDRDREGVRLKDLVS